MIATADTVASRVAEAYQSGVPVSYGCGPLADRRAKKALGMPGSQSMICAAIKAARKQGLIVVVVTGDHVTACSGNRVHVYPVVELRPADAVTSV